MEMVKKKPSWLDKLRIKSAFDLNRKFKSKRCKGYEKEINE